MGYRIGLVIPYFGKFHNYFQLWLQSCAGNPDVDFLLFTDDHTQYSFPPNVKVTYMTFKEMKMKVQHIFDFEIELSEPYKLCDYRPAYGEIFQEELKGYDYWGHCDTDLIWGRIRTFWPDNIIKKYDKIGDSGHFSLYRNKNDMVTAYRTLRSQGCYDYRDVYTSPKSFAFDEWGEKKGINQIILKNGLSIYYKPILFSNIRSNSYGLYNNRSIYDLPHLAEIEKKKHDIVFRYCNGVLEQFALDENNSVSVHEEAYIHLILRPMVVSFENQCVNSFVIVPPNVFKSISPEFQIDKNFLLSIKENHIYWHHYRVRAKNAKRKAERLWKKITQK